MAPECRAFWRTQRLPAAKAVAYMASWMLLVIAAVQAEGAHSAWRWPIACAAIAAAWLGFSTALNIAAAAMKHQRSHGDTT